MPNKIMQKQRQSIDERLILILAAFAYFLFFAHPAEAQSKKNSKDTLRFTAPAVVVTGNKISNNPAIKLTSSQVITRENIETIPALQISDVIDKSPGVYVKNYGGAGGLKTVNIRGTNSSQNVIMLDGVPLNSKQNAMFDLSILPLSFVNEIEIVRGGASDLFGSNAMGGAVNLLSDSRRSDRYKMSYFVGSYNEHKASISTPSYQIGDFNFSLSGSGVYSEGDYKFRFSEYGEDKILRRENAKFDNLGLFLNSGYMIDIDKYISFKTINTYTLRGVPGAVVQNRLESKFATLSDLSSFNNLSYNSALSKEDFLKVTLVAKHNKQVYDDAQPNAIAELDHAEFQNTEFAMLAANTYEGDWFKLNTNLDYTYSTLEGDMLDPSVDRHVFRHNLSFANILDKSIYFTNGDMLSIAPSFRVELYNTFAPAYSYAIAFLHNSAFDSENMFPITSKFRYSRNFRMPSFNELYYYNYGTSDLLPEKSHSFDLAFTVGYSKYISLELSTYFIRTKDQIVSVPKNTISWTAMNIGLVETKGIEALLNLHLFSGIVDFSFAYTRQEVIDKSENSFSYGKYIIYTPQEIINSTLNLNLSDRIALQGNAEYSSHRFALPDNTYDSMLGNYLILNAAVFYKFEFLDMNCRLQFELKNILDKNYQMILNYPMPGRVFRVGINLDF